MLYTLRILPQQKRTSEQIFSKLQETKALAPTFNTHVGHSMSSEPNFQHSDPRMKLSICETKTMNRFGDFFQNFKKVGFLKIQISKIL
jgi:hypothetical protein